MQIIQTFLVEYQCTLALPINAKPVHVYWNKQGDLAMDVLLDPQAPVVPRHFRMRAAGLPFFGRIRYIAPITFDDGKVIHLVEELGDQPTTD